MSTVLDVALLVLGVMLVWLGAYIYGYEQGVRECRRQREIERIAELLRDGRKS